MAVAGGLTQAMFPEGGLTRDGLLRPPKFGLLSYMVSSFDPHGARDAVFVPVGINYDRVIEDRVQIAALTTPAGEKPRFRFNPAVLAAFLFNNLALRLRGKLYRYGYACVSFGKPVSLRDYLGGQGIDFRTLSAERRREEIERLGTMLMEKVGEVVPALPVSLVATAVLDAAAPLSALELKARVAELVGVLGQRGAHVHIPRADQDYADEVGLRMLLLRHLVDEQDGLYRANSAEEMLLRYYANSIAHLVHGTSAHKPLASAPLVAAM
jgi:glycerol-3-phosphate O-acyltransferase